jgi:hypothetical protein
MEHQEPEDGENTGNRKIGVGRRCPTSPDIADGVKQFAKQKRSAGSSSRRFKDKQHSSLSISQDSNDSSSRSPPPNNVNIIINYIMMYNVIKIHIMYVIGRIKHSRTRKYGIG